MGTTSTSTPRNPSSRGQRHRDRPVRTLERRDQHLGARHRKRQRLRPRPPRDAGRVALLVRHHGAARRHGQQRRRATSTSAPPAAPHCSPPDGRSRSALCGGIDRRVAHLRRHAGQLTPEDTDQSHDIFELTASGAVLISTGPDDQPGGETYSVGSTSPPTGHAFCSTPASTWLPACRRAITYTSAPGARPRCSGRPVRVIFRGLVGETIFHRRRLGSCPRTPMCALTSTRTPEASNTLVSVGTPFRDGDQPSYVGASATRSACSCHLEPGAARGHEPGEGHL